MSNKNDTRNMLLTASPWKLVLSLSVPAIIGIMGNLVALDLLFSIMIAPKAMLSLFITEPEIVAQGAGDFRLFFTFRW